MEVDFINHGVGSKLNQKPVLELQLADGEAGLQGNRVHLEPEEIESMNFKILTAMGDRQMEFFIRREQPIELLFFRRIFTRLREQKARGQNPSGRIIVEDEVEENVPIQAFQRAMGRLFYALRDPEGFDSKVYDQNGNNCVGWGEFCFVWKDRQITIRLSTCEMIYLTFDDPQSSYMARVVSVVTLGTIVLSSLGFILSTVPEFQDSPADGSSPKHLPAFDVIENCCLILFVMEYLVRLCTCWAIRDEVFDKEKLLDLITGYERIQLASPATRVFNFVMNGQNLVDLAAILPGVITGLIFLFTGNAGAGGGGFVVLRLIRLTRIFRAFRLGKYVESVVVITDTVKQSTKVLYLLAFMLLLGVVIFGSLIYLMEQGEWDSETHEYNRVVDWTWNATKNEFQKEYGITPFKSIPHAFWWALVTSTTVGYGDHYPTTPNGKIVAVVCMVWSLVILALPVGVLGATFTQVWDGFAKNRKIEAAVLRREMVSVAHAIQRIEPVKASRILLLQVWNDDGQTEAMPACPEDFMGEVKIELDLPPDTEIRGREMRLKLNTNHSIVVREIFGTLVVRYDWVPAGPGTAVERIEEAEDGEPAPQSRHTVGTLRLEIIAASDLINVDWGRHFGRSSPCVMALCYPASPAQEGHLLPVVWRSPTAQHTLDPVWQCAHTFQYQWYVPLDTPENRNRACSRMSASVAKAPFDKVTRFCDSTGGSSNSNRSPLQPFFPDSPGPDEVMIMLMQLTSSMPKLTSSLGQIQEQVVNLSKRVDHLSVSLRDRGIGSSASSRELRGLGRGEPGSALSLQPAGRERGEPMKPTWNRSEPPNGVGTSSSRSPVMEDSLEEVMNDVGCVVGNGGPSSAFGPVAPASSLPHAIPRGPDG